MYYKIECSDSKVVEFLKQHFTVRIDQRELYLVFVYADTSNVVKQLLRKQWIIEEFEEEFFVKTK